ncbi:MAG: protein kinase [Anaerolineales bacterium]|nr:protein kinase [Anaerolineales bacterium]
MSEIRSFLDRHLKSIFNNDLDTYHATTVGDLTLYEWYVTPHRIDGLPFHDFMMTESAREDTSGMALDPKPEGGRPEDKARLRFDLANYFEQRYGDTGVCSYTMLISKGTSEGVKVISYNESRVLARIEGEWKVVHVHKSPSWGAPFQPTT